MSGAKVFQFHEQLKVGAEGELLLQKYYHDGPLTFIKEHYSDFTTPNGKILECKCEVRTLYATPNFFMERFSNWDKKKDGGPWQSLTAGADIFVVFFLNSGVYYEFKDLPLLVETLNKLIEKMRYISIRNRGFLATGYVIKRTALKHLYTEHIIPDYERKI